MIAATGRSPTFLPRRPTQWGVLAYDVVIAMLVMAVVLIGRYQFEPKPLPGGMVVQATLAFGAISAVIFPLFHLHRSLWRYTALNDIVAILRAVVVTNLLLLPVLFLMDRLIDFPRTGILLEYPALVIVLILSRLIIRGWQTGDLASTLSLDDPGTPWALVVGDPQAASDYLADQGRRSVQRRQITGIVTTSHNPVPGRINGTEVLGTLDQLERILSAMTLEGRDLRVVLAELRPSRDLMERVMQAAASTGVRVERRRSAGAPLSPIETADLLDRPPRQLDLAATRVMVEGKRVLVTGAGGTIGSELTRQILRFGPEAVTLVDASEYNLYAIDLALSESGAPKVWQAELADVRDRPRMAQLFEQHRPDIVLHAAALKHVPLMELHPAEAVLTNIAGARLVAELALETAAVFAFISTDKAVNPTNVMGATKRIAEQVVRAICDGTSTRPVVVRFGNVLGSNGSVVPLFERQIAEGGPVTVTHPEMVRYFMTVQEASSLVLQAAGLPPSPEGLGGVFVLDMGEPVRIDDLARQMIHMHGLRPGVDIEIRHAGLRPGEKLFEEIFYSDEQVVQTAADGILSAFEAPRVWYHLEPKVDALISAAALREDAETLHLMSELVPEFTRTAPALSQG